MQQPPTTREDRSLKNALQPTLMSRLACLTKAPKHSGLCALVENMPDEPRGLIWLEVRRMSILLDDVQVTELARGIGPQGKSDLM
jgi:hypothetical protein